MQALRRYHLILSSLFSPLLLYFSLSGAWQTFRLNDIPRGASPTPLQRFFHEVSKPHKNGILPGQDPKLVHGVGFNVFVVAMALGIAATTVLGIAIALQMMRMRRLVLVLLLIGTLLPIGLLFAGG
jgi:hypothetical protein